MRPPARPPARPAYELGDFSCSCAAGDDDDENVDNDDDDDDDDSFDDNDNDDMLSSWGLCFSCTSNDEEEGRSYVMMIMIVI